MRAAAEPAKQNALAPSRPAEKPPTPAVASINDAERARQLVRQGRAALQSRDYAKARQLAMQARDMKPDLQWWDDTPDKLKPFAEEFKMNYPVLVGLDRDDLQDAYGPMWGIPTTFVISRDGRICRKNSGLVGKAKYETDIKGLL